MVVVLPAPVGPTTGMTPPLTLERSSTTGRCLTSSASGICEGRPGKCVRRERRQRRPHPARCPYAESSSRRSPSRARAGACRSRSCRPARFEQLAHILQFALHGAVARVLSRRTAAAARCVRAALSAEHARVPAQPFAPAAAGCRTGWIQRRRRQRAAPRGHGMSRSGAAPVSRARTRQFAARAGGWRRGAQRALRVRVDEQASS